MAVQPSPGRASATGDGAVLGGTVPILLYHAVSDDPPGWIARFTVSPAAFAAHLDAVVASGRDPLTVSQYVDRRRDGTLPERPVVITVDDGFADFAGNGQPMLAETESVEHAIRDHRRAR